ncbi:MAG: rhodanese-like domain-containing protein [Acidimicrobiaceae bacterium]|nr:rhodanese-like domain-containing protein [Acidimicrobiaceae bacterium]MYA74524.1 rhodanese-like domain-containing protein [Acidimicrobiaceae bacterium]MYD08142.1 rhodanese-like domain-containing protein [Acidimicrobiaceae bacterium]MYG56386.1 rhodanese-like domain-containing protein [Acidimicrobiaceae bacterium]MYI60023.1 rhodanese-like domain-containing protein [Acidimicrobiaceae bacterium]
MTPIDRRLAEARQNLDRVEPAELPEMLSAGAILVDIRPESFRQEEGVHPEAMIIERNVLEWRLDPNSEARIIDIEPDTPIIIMCNEGYASSLAAADLVKMGFSAATDLIGGYRGWRAQA